MTIPNDDDDTPDRGYLAWVNFDPRVGHEQSGNRPAVILSPYDYHAKTPYMIVCPITSNLTPYPFKVELPQACRSVVLYWWTKSSPWTVGLADATSSVSCPNRLWPIFEEGWLPYWVSNDLNKRRK